MLRYPILYISAILLLMSACTSIPPSYDAAYQEAYKNGICNVHHVQMHKEMVPIIYGLLIEEPGVGPSSKTRLYHFPFADKYSVGGCDVMPNSPKKELIFVCPECLSQEQQWIIKHPRDSWAKERLKNKNA